VTATIVSSSTLGAIKGATGGIAQGHLVYAANTGRWWFFTYVGKVDSGTATSGSKSQLADTGKTWTAGQYLGYACIITGGTGSGQAFTIGNNTSTVLPVIDNGATGSWLGTALAAGSTYEIIEATRVRAYVSSSADLTTATWSEATGSPSPSIADGTSLGLGINLAGGKNNPGGYGEFPVDGRLLAVGYGSISSVDVVHLLTQQDSHYIHTTERARLTAATTITWDANVHSGGGGSGWNDTAPGVEDAPDFPQALSIGLSSTNRWWWVNEENFQPVSGYASGVVDNGTANQDPSWAGNNGGVKPTSFDNAVTGAPWQSAVVPLASGFMLAVYCFGDENGTTPSGGNTYNAGLRFAESASATQWPTSTTAGAAVPNLSSAHNHPNDWGICRVSDTDVHVVRRNSGTVLEHVRYSGHGGSWGAKVTLPSTGLTGQQAGSGVPLVSDGTSVWAFVLDTDASHSIRYLKWTSGGGWASSWSTLSTSTEAKDFLTATYGNSMIGVAWTANSSAPYAVNVAALTLSSPGLKNAQARYAITVPTAGWRNAGCRYLISVPPSTQPWSQPRPLSGSLM
jgi:hypothetical protein